MSGERREDVAAGLLAHLRLSAAEATVVVDEHVSPYELLLLVYDEAASRRVRGRTPESWRGHRVSLKSGLTLAP